MFHLVSELRRLCYTLIYWENCLKVADMVKCSGVVTLVGSWLEWRCFKGGASLCKAVAPFANRIVALREEIGTNYRLALCCKVEQWISFPGAVAWSRCQAEVVPRGILKMVIITADLIAWLWVRSGAVVLIAVEFAMMFSAQLGLKNFQVCSEWLELLFEYWVCCGSGRDNYFDSLIGHLGKLVGWILACGKYCLFLRQ